MIHITVNKYDKFVAPDPTPLSIKYVAFAAFNNIPMEFYYNCSSGKHVDMMPKSEKIVLNHTLHKTLSNSTVKTPSFMFVKSLSLTKLSPIEFALLLLSSMILTINLVIVYYVFLLSRYID